MGRAFPFLLLAVLYLAQGLPLGFAFEALPTLLRQQGADLTLLALVPVIGLPWLLKPMWAPLTDRFGSARFGHRRSWVLPMQMVLILCQIVLALWAWGPDQALGVLGVTLLAALAAATQDTATDGFAAETMTGRALAWANGVQVGGMMAGVLIGGGGCLLLAGWLGMQSALLVLAGLQALTLVPPLVWREQPRPADRQRAGLVRCFTRPALPRLMVVVVTQGVAYAAGTSLLRVTLVDAGWSLDQIGLISTGAGVMLMAGGSVLGAVLVNRLGGWWTLGLGLAGGAGALVGLWAVPTNDPGAVWALTLGLALAGGLASVAASTLIMRFAAAGTQAGTDGTVLQAASVLGEMAATSIALALLGTAGPLSALIFLLSVVGLGLALLPLAARAAPRLFKVAKP